MGQSDVTKSKISGSQQSPSTKGETRIFIGSHPLSEFHMIPEVEPGLFRRSKFLEEISTSDK
jgi:hypothetical protein